MDMIDSLTDTNIKKCSRIGNKYACFFPLKNSTDYALLNNYSVQTGWHNRCLKSRTTRKTKKQKINERKD